MRNVNIADCENMFIKDEYRHIVFDEDDLMAVINGEYVVKTPSIDDDDTESTPNKRVTWRESLEEAFYDTDDECVIVDMSKSQIKVDQQKRNQFRRQFSVEDPVSSSERVVRPSSGGKSHSAPSSPVKSPLHTSSLSPRTLRRSRSADRSSSSRGRVSEPRVTGHTHVYGELQNKVRRVRCRHTSTNEEQFLTSQLKPVFQYFNNSDFL